MSPTIQSFFSSGHTTTLMTPTWTPPKPSRSRPVEAT
jgi:hypothetical protein